MTCGGCERAVKGLIESGLRSRGVVEASADRSEGSATVTLARDSDVSGSDVADVINGNSTKFKSFAQVEREGEPMPRSEKETIELEVAGMECDQCARWVQESLNQIQSVERASVNLQRRTASVQTQSSVSIQSLMQAVLHAGYRSKPYNPSEAQSAAHLVEDGEHRELLGENGRKTTKQGKDAASSDIAPGNIQLDVSGMTCASCATAVEQAAKSVHGVETAAVNLVAESAKVNTAAGANVDPEEVASAINDAGYSASPRKAPERCSVSFHVAGMVCSACPGRVELALLSLRGVHRAEVSDMLEKLTVSYDPDIIGSRRIKAKLSDLGYTVTLWQNSNGNGSGSGDSVSRYRHDSEVRRWMRDLIASGAFGIPLLLLSVLFGNVPGIRGELLYDLLPSNKEGTLPLLYVIAWALATPVQFWVGWSFYGRATKALKQGGANMEVLVMMGSTVAYLYSAAIVVWQATTAETRKDVFFDTGAMLIFFVVIGKYLEARAKGKTSEAIQHLVELQPANAVLVREPSMTEEEISAAFVEKGDLLRVAPGSSVPADGTVEQGSGAVDESMITGESMPVKKRLGDTAIGGTINQAGSLYVRVQSLGADSMLSKIIQLVEDAQASKPHIQALADMVSSYFVPCVVTVALATLIIWLAASYSGSVPTDWKGGESNFLFSLLFALAVLVIACPCALGLAVPTAMMVGTGLGARHGVLIKGGPALESLATLATCVFDKTGTLTTGQPQVTSIELTGRFEWEKSSLLRNAAAAERQSEHPLAGAIIRAAESMLGEQQVTGAGAPTVTDFTSTVGRGVECHVDGKHLLVASVSYAQELGALHPDVEDQARRLQSAGNTVVAVCHVSDEVEDAKLDCVGLIGFADVVKPDAPSAISRLHDQGFKCMLMTGDNERTAAAIANEVNIPTEHVMANVRPEGKANAVQRLQNRAGGKACQVAFVGDGINDAPALAQADVGIGIGAGTDIAIEAADVVIIRNQLLDVTAAYEIAKATLKRIKLNLLLSLMYNSLGIPIAAGVIFPAVQERLPPIAAAAAMALSSVSVVVSSLLLGRFVPSSKLQKQGEGATGTTDKSVSIN
jgi:Cu+-exporting ATPase